MWIEFLTVLAAISFDPGSFQVGTFCPNSHAHNDYEHRRPLLEALEQGFASVEADIHLAEGQLLVGHDAHQLRPERTLEALYLEPLRLIAGARGGAIHPKGQPLILLVDIKTEAEAAYQVLRGVLARYKGILTRFRDGKTEPGAVTVILSGNRPRATLLAEVDRWAAYDGRLADLDGNWPVSFMPLVSESWVSQFTWRGIGALPAEEAKKLRGLAERAHAQGRLIRFWAAPDFAASWTVQREARIDLINTDRLAPLREFLCGR